MNQITHTEMRINENLRARARSHTRTQKNIKIGTRVDLVSIEYKN